MKTIPPSARRPLPTAAILALAVLAPAGCRPSTDTALQVTYYYDPACPVCEEIRVEVGKLPQRFSNRVRARSVAVDEPAEVEEMTAFGFASHGMVVRSGDGEVLWRRGDDQLDLEQAQVALVEMIGVGPARRGGGS